MAEWRDVSLPDLREALSTSLSGFEKVYDLNLTLAHFGTTHLGKTAIFLSNVLKTL